jgi:hypothetical protein
MQPNKPTKPNQIAATAGWKSQSRSEKSELVGGAGFQPCAIESSVTLAVAAQFPFSWPTLK